MGEELAKAGAAGGRGGTSAGPASGAGPAGSADAAICVFVPTVVTGPHTTRLHCLGRFAYRA
ncbi:hypothetical protein [Kitasatospora xanthocidica]|uniref:hypothetical protein n=1 Tax=Kitasatospora xanthocidica TaxID=83382 RepID=UPI00167828C1|nr:hypothetical protein [Kitasatospora xanthocidica]